MKNLQKLALPAAVLAGVLAASTPVHAANQPQENKNTMSIVAGHNVIDAVDDLRETTADLVEALLESQNSFAFNDWSATETRLKNQLRELDSLERTLDKKEEATDSSWLSWMSDRDYNVTVKTQVESLAQHLNTIKNTLDEAKESDRAQIIVSHNIVDQVDDVRETVGDLLHAISDAGPQQGWFDDNELFAREHAQLNQMEMTLDKKADLTDEEWNVFFSSPDYRVSIRDSIDELSNMVKSVAGKLAGAGQVTSIN